MQIQGKYDMTDIITYYKKQDGSMILDQKAPNLRKADVKTCYTCKFAEIGYEWELRCKQYGIKTECYNKDDSYIWFDEGLDVDCDCVCDDWESK